MPTWAHFCLSNLRCYRWVCTIMLCCSINKAKSDSFSSLCPPDFVEYKAREERGCVPNLSRRVSRDNATQAWMPHRKEEMAYLSSMLASSSFTWHSHAWFWFYIHALLGLCWSCIWNRVACSTFLSSVHWNVAVSLKWMDFKVFYVATQTAQTGDYLSKFICCSQCYLIPILL